MLRQRLVLTCFLTLAVVAVGLATGASRPTKTSEEPFKPAAITPAAVVAPILVATSPPTPEPLPETPKEPESRYVIYDVPLSKELQRYTQDVCEEYGVNYPLVLAIMKQESEFRTDAISTTGDHGIMQINAGNHEWLEGVLGITDWLDPEQNILAGVYVLSQIDYDDPHQILMSYNCGPSGAKNLWADGIYSTAYSRAVVENLNGLEVMTLE